MFKDTHIVLIPKLVRGPGGSQPFVARGTMELEQRTKIYNTITRTV